MTRSLLALVLLFKAITVCAAPGPILVLGDSISAAYGMSLQQGWVALLQGRLQATDRSAEVVNASVSGDTTDNALARLPGLLDRYRPRLVIVELGGNDGLRGLPISVMRRNLKALIEAAQAGGAQVLLLGMRLPANYGTSYNQKFNHVYAELAQQYHLALVPFFMQGVADDPALMQADGIHPAASGQERLLDNLWPVLLQSLDGG